MSHISRLAVSTCLFLIISACSSHDEGEPSIGAEGMPGAKERTAQETSTPATHPAATMDANNPKPGHLTLI